MRPNEKEVELAVLQPHRLGSAKSPGSKKPQGTSKSVVIDRMRARPDGAPSKRSRVLWLAALAEETLSSSRDVIRHMIGREYVSLVLFWPQRGEVISWWRCDLFRGWIVKREKSESG